MTAMNPRLVEAVKHKQRLRFLYNGKMRLVEPQCYGIGSKGTELLRAHQLQGGHERGPLFDVSKIVYLEILDETFSRPGPHYKRDDSAMATIFAQL
jgi:predicted DNA-binding transcriptional regulator YafY